MLINFNLWKNLNYLNNLLFIPFALSLFIIKNKHFSIFQNTFYSCFITLKEFKMFSVKCFSLIKQVKSVFWKIEMCLFFNNLKPSLNLSHLWAKIAYYFYLSGNCEQETKMSHTIHVHVWIPHSNLDNVTKFYS